MVRHLGHDQILATLRRGVGVAQLLGWTEPIDDQPTLKYVTIRPEGSRDAVWYVAHESHVFDQGSDTFWDVGEFSEVTEWDPLEGIDTTDPGFTWDDIPLRDPSYHRFSTPEAALDWASRNLSPLPDRWVHESMIDSEYREARQAHNPWPAAPPDSHDHSKQRSRN